LCRISRYSRIVGSIPGFRVLSQFLFPAGQKIARILPVEREVDPLKKTMATACRHPKVRIVSRQEDAEFVECLECAEVFDAEEFRDMEIEDSAETESVQDDS
jgi:hypothetical protein